MCNKDEGGLNNMYCPGCNRDRPEGTRFTWLCISRKSYCSQCIVNFVENHDLKIFGDEENYNAGYADCEQDIKNRMTGMLDKKDNNKCECCTDCKYSGASSLLEPCVSCLNKINVNNWEAKE